MTIGARIREIRKAHPDKLSQEKFGVMLGLTRDQIKTYELDKVETPENVVKLICREFNVSYLWLTEGVEPMYTPEDISVINQLTNIMNSDNEFAKRVFTEFAKMPREAWLALENVIDSLAKK